MQVYIEYVIIDNIIIDYLLLKYTFILLKNKGKFWRLLLCAVLGAVFAVVMPIIHINNAWLITIKLIFSALLVFFAVRHRSLNGYLAALAVFNTYTFLLGGGVLGIFNILKIPLNQDYSLGLTLLSAYIIIKLMSVFLTYIYRKRNIESFTADCEITLNGKTIKTSGFFDSGNRLYDEESKLPIVICSKGIAYNLVSSETSGKYVNIVTVAGSKRILVFKVDELKIKNHGEKTYKEVLLGVSDNAFNEGYQLILHSEYIRGGESYAKITNNKTKESA